MDLPYVGGAGGAQQKRMVSIVRLPLNLDHDVRERLRDAGIPTPPEPASVFRCYGKLRQERRSHFALDIHNLIRENEKRGFFLVDAELSSEDRSGQRPLRRFALIFSEDRDAIACHLKTPTVQKAIQEVLEIPVRGMSVAIYRPDGEPEVECLDFRQLCQHQTAERELYFDGEWETRPFGLRRSFDHLQSRAQASA